MKNATAKFDLQRTLTCAVLATITSLGTFSAIVNVMTPMFAGIRLLASGEMPQKMSLGPIDETVCVKSSLIDGNEAAHRMLLI